jgi:UPF0271 protein
MPQNGAVPVIDLNADLGEGAGTEAEIMPLISSTSIACGGHAGDASSMASVSALAARHGVVIGAHPSYPDRQGFGRGAFTGSLVGLAETLRSQIASLAAVAPVRFLKPHGALYNDAVAVPDLADLVVALAASFGLVLLCPGGSEMALRATGAGVAWRAEAFADRAYRADGRLAARSSSGAVLTSAAAVAERAVELAKSGRVRNVDGEWLSVPADSICLHGDTPGAVNLARAIRRRLEEAGVEIRPFT